ncbi:YkuS family protein [Dethiothermospora halolimnae]|uniref:YkuS family protein n=1 Tax=Dethiothermospora halolimnae TaxID=3114390 RepID=UPI003CCB834F
MEKKVVVENTLKSHIDFLENSGYDVHKLYKNKNLNNITSFDYDGIVVSDTNKTNMSSSTDYRTGAPIIEAKNKTPEEVYNILRSRY